MAITIFNPKYFKKILGETVENTAEVKRFVWSHAYWNLKVGEMKKFPDEVGKAMLRLMEFLIEVTDKNIKDIKKELEQKLFKCDKCDFETDTRISLLGHSRKHMNEVVNNEDMKVVQDAVPQGTFKKQVSGKKLSIEDEEGIPAGETTDSDGVPWVGAGLQEEGKSGFSPKLV